MNLSPLLDQFNQDIGTAERLLELIEIEFQALSGSELDRLQQVLTEKMPLLALLEEHGRTRSQTLLGHKLSADRAGLQALAAQSEQRDALLAASDQLGELLQRCQAANLRNGRIIRSNQKSTDNLLSILRGNETPSLYDSKGGAARIGDKRPLSQA